MRTTRGLGRTFVAINVVALLAVGLWMRMRELDHLPGFTGDEAWYGLQALRLLHRQAVEWELPIGRLGNPILITLLAALHAIWSPSVALLRWPAAITGVLAVAINYPLCRRAFDRPTAIITTVILAVLPVNIVYSRLGWEQSQILITTLPIVYFPLLAVGEQDHRLRWLIAAALMFVAAMFVHPTNVFTLTLMLIPGLWAYRGELKAALRAHRSAWQWAAAVCLAGVAVLAIAWLAEKGFALAARRVPGDRNFPEFAWNYQRLFSGLTVYRWTTGSLPPTPSARDDLTFLDLIGWLVVVVTGWSLWRLCHRQERIELDGCLLCSWASMLAGFYVVAG